MKLLIFNFWFLIDSHEITWENSNYGGRKLGYRNRKNYTDPS